MAINDQVPVQSPFGHESTGEQVLGGIDLAGKVAVVTGGYSGIGLETTKALAGHGARVVVPVRSPEKAQDALAGVPGEVRTAQLDLADLTSVRSLAEALRDEYDRIDLLINNAGIMAAPLRRVGPGWESQFGINHMGHFALTTAILPLLQQQDARVVVLSSSAHKRSDILWDDPQFERTPYDKWQAYGQAKTADALFANALSRRLAPTGGTAFSVHPGGIFTPLQRHLPTEEMIALGWLGDDGKPSEMAKAGFKSPEQGCATTLWAATSPLLGETSGVYCEDCNVAQPTDPSDPAGRFRGVNDYACDDDAAERLWQLSEDLLNAA